MINIWSSPFRAPQQRPVPPARSRRPPAAPLCGGARWWLSPEAATENLELRLVLSSKTLGKKKKKKTFGQLFTSENCWVGSFFEASGFVYTPMATILFADLCHQLLIQALRKCTVWWLKSVWSKPKWGKHEKSLKITSNKLNVDQGR